MAHDLSFLDQKTHNAPFAVVEGRLGKVTDYCVPVNPYFPTKEMLTRYAMNLEEILTYYPEDGDSLPEMLAAHLNIPAKNIVLGNGSTELITAIDHLYIKDSFMTSVPTFGRWTDQSAETGKRVVPFYRLESEGFQLDIDRMVETIKKEKIRAIAISNPNNPTGCITPPEAFKPLFDLDLDLIIIDESFFEFSTMDRRFSCLSLGLEQDNVIILRSLGKSLGAHGVRLGYAVGSETLIRGLRRFLPRWNINAMAVTLLRDFPKYQNAYETSRKRVIEDREYLYQKLLQFPELKVFPSFANFLYVKVNSDFSGKDLRNALIENHGCFVRECGNKIGSSSQFLRIAVNPKEATDRLVEALHLVLPVLQGTSSTFSK